MADSMLCQDQRPDRPCAAPLSLLCELKGCVSAAVQVHSAKDGGGVVNCQPHPGEGESEEGLLLSGGSPTGSVGLLKGRLVETETVVHYHFHIAFFHFIDLKLCVVTEITHTQFVIH